MQNELLFIIHITMVLLGAVVAGLSGAVALRGLVILYAVFANLFVVKTLAMGPLTACGGGMYMVGVGVGLLLLERYQSPRYATETVRLTIAASLLFCLITGLHLLFVAAPGDFSQISYELLFGRMPRVTIVSLLAHGISQYGTLITYRFLARFFSQRSAHNTALWSGQILDTLLFFTGSFWGIVPQSQIIEMIAISFCVKTSMVVISSIIIAFFEWYRAHRAHLQEQEERLGSHFAHKSEHENSEGL